jgi:very-short-patch-repair endonuclease
MITSSVQVIMAKVMEKKEEANQEDCKFHLVHELVQYRECKIHVIWIDNEIWFRGRHVATALTYKDCGQAIRKNVDAKYKNTLGNLYRDVFKGRHYWQGMQRTTIYLDRTGLCSLLCASTVPNKQEFIDWYKDQFKVDIFVITRLLKEQETIGQIIQAFSHLSPQRQYIVGTYRMDLYFPDQKLAVECDEWGHRDRDPNQEATREDYIKKHLSCKILRYNPDSPGFCVFDVINKIIRDLYH